MSDQEYALHNFQTNGPGVIGSDLCTVCGKERQDHDSVQSEAPDLGRPVPRTFYDFDDDAVETTEIIRAANAGTLYADANEIEAAQRIFEVMCGGPVDWAKHVADTNEDNLFQSADWACCLAYAKAALRTEAKTVKLLDWEAFSGEGEPNEWYARSPCGTFYIEADGDQFAMYSSIATKVRHFSFREDAEAAAQSDYEQYASSLTTLPHQEGA